MQKINFCYFEQIFGAIFKIENYKIDARTKPSKDANWKVNNISTKA